MNEERLKYLQSKREDYNTNPMWQKREYVSYSHPKLLEKAGYRVENIDDFAKLEVYDAKTGCPLLLDEVRHDAIVFKDEKSGKFFEVHDNGYIKLMLPSSEELVIVCNKDINSAIYGFSHDLNLGFFYYTSFKTDDDINLVSVNKAEKDKNLALVKLQIGNEDIEVRQNINSFVVRDTSLSLLNPDFPEKYVKGREEMDKDSFISLFTTIIGLSKAKKIDNNHTNFVYDFIMECLSFHAQDFIDYRYDTRCIQALINSYRNQQNSFTDEYNAIKARYDSEMMELDQLILSEEQLLKERKKH